MNRRAAFAGLLVVAVLVGAYLTSARRTEGPPLDPGSTSRDGARAVVALVDRFGEMDVLERVPTEEVRAALVLQDRFDRDAEAELVAWVRAGGTLVVADPGSTLAPRITGTITGQVDVGCDIAGLEQVRTLDVGDGLLLEPPDGAATCTAPGTGVVATAETVGDGRIVSLGGPWLLTNDLLDEADNAVLVVGLLVPGDGAPSAFVRPSLAVGSGDEGLLDLVGTPVWAALAQLVVAFVVVALWRARRLGRPVLEPQLVQIEGSELTDAVGRLLTRSRRPARAAAVLRDHTRRAVSAPLGLPLDAPAEVVVATLAARTSLTEDEARRAATAPVTTDDELVAVADLLYRITEETAHGREPAPR